MNPDSFQYAIENTKVILPPRRRLETFGTSLLHYYLITEDMDLANVSRVREGRIEAERPRIMSPENFTKLLLEGFGDRGAAYADFISSESHRFAFLRHGFTFRKNEIQSYDVHEPAAAVIDKIREEVEAHDDAFSAVLTGVDDGWEVCLLKFMVDFVHQSAPGQIEDFRKRGLLGGEAG